MANENTAGQPIYEIPICSCGRQNSAGECEHVKPLLRAFFSPAWRGVVVAPRRSSGHAKRKFRISADRRWIEKPAGGVWKQVEAIDCSRAVRDPDGGNYYWAHSVAARFWCPAYQILPIPEKAR